MDFNGFMLWILNSGGSIVIVSWLSEQIPAFQALTPVFKKWVFFGGSFLVAGIAYSVLNFVPATVLGQIAPIFQLLYVAFTTVFVSDIFHKNTKA
jgi:hypothetical protein